MGVMKIDGDRLRSAIAVTAAILSVKVFFLMFLLSSEDKPYEWSIANILSFIGIFSILFIFVTFLQYLKDDR